MAYVMNRKSHVGRSTPFVMAMRARQTTKIVEYTAHLSHSSKKLLMERAERLNSFQNIGWKDCEDTFGMTTFFMQSFCSS